MEKNQRKICKITIQAPAKPAPAASSAKRPASDNLQGPTAKRSPLTSNENRPTPGRYGASQAIDPASVTVFPIASLTPYQNKWIIKAR